MVIFSILKDFGIFTQAKDSDTESEGEGEPKATSNEEDMDVRDGALGAAAATRDGFSMC